MRSVQPAEVVGGYRACLAGCRRSGPRRTSQRPTLDGAKQQQVLAARQLLPQHVKLQRRTGRVVTATTLLSPLRAGSLRQLLCHPHGTIACAAGPHLRSSCCKPANKASPEGKHPSADARGPCRRRRQCWCRTPMHRLHTGAVENPLRELGLPFHAPPNNFVLVRMYGRQLAHGTLASFLKHEARPKSLPSSPPEKGSTPVRQLMVVDLPAPLGPSRQKHSPG